MHRVPLPGRDRAAAGFTLLELLVALAVLGMAASLIVAGLHLGGLVLQRGTATAAGLDEVVAVQRVLRRSIERLQPLVRLDTAQPILDFRGTEGLLRYVAPPAERDGPGALTRYQLVRTATGDVVLYSANTRVAQLDAQGYDLAGWKPTTILRGTRQLQIRYRGVPPTGGDRVWLDQWTDRTTAPDLIRIHVEFAARDPRRWPDLVVRPQVAEVP
jgi:general secretion pathway protein J